MEVNLRWTLVLCTISMALMFPSAVNSDPIKIDFTKCQTATYPLAPGPNPPQQKLQCCPILPKKPIVDGLPYIPKDMVRVRKASQCVDEAYAAKLSKAYALMKALPNDDPRSFSQQWLLHCSYCGGAFITVNSTGIPTGVDIHFSWLFYPWHRYFLFFHERILQSLLGDPTFSLNYWNWDSPYTVGDGSSKDGTCLKAGEDFPALFSDPSTHQYDSNRSANAKGLGHFRFPDFTYSPILPASQQALYNATEQELLSSNLNVMYRSLVTGATTKETFMGRPYHSGDTRGDSSPSGGAGALEFSAHAGVHFWTGQEFPIGYDMGQLAFSARDPVFFAHHSNLDRLWQVWKDIGPILGQNREYYSDPDFLNAEFLFYDENKDLRRVYVRDTFDTKKLGYVYQKANDAAWLFPNVTRCSKISAVDTIAQAESLPAPVKYDGYYYIESTKPFIIVIDRPNNPQGLEEFLTIDGIKLDRSKNAGFEVFVDLLYPGDYTAPCKCAEYSGTFMNMAQHHHHVGGKKTYIWKQSIAKTLFDIKAPLAPSKLVITLLPKLGHKETIKFTTIVVETK